MARKGEGCQWQKPGFSVFMHIPKKDNPCQKCVNNKYRGGNPDICDNCDKYDSFKEG